MRSRLKLGRPGHATVVAYLALFIALGGGAYAASLGKNSVGTKQLKKNSVTTAKIKNAAVTSAKLAGGAVGGAQLLDNAVTGAKVQDGSLTGADINQASLNSVRAANVTGIAMNANCSPVVPFPSGVSATTAGTGCMVTFPTSVINCAATATVGVRTSALVLAQDRTVQTDRNPNQPNVIGTFPYAGGASAPEPVDLTLVC